MLFNSYTFIIFFAFVLLFTRMIGHWRSRKAVLLLVSYLFYAAWNPPFVLLLWLSTVIDWYVGKSMARASSCSSRRILLSISLIVNFGMLGVFKYGGFLINNVNRLLDLVGAQIDIGNVSIILPVGISFYTFQTLSYTLDIYRGKMRPWHSFLDFALYVTFFPQLVAGPIVRASEFLPQCASPRVGTRTQVAYGLYMLIFGLFCKVVLADELMAPIVEEVFDSSVQPGFLSSWTGTLAFAMQIFYDFFGYSTCAIGVALCLGFDLPDNFRFPYAARGLSDFWQRWHISLSSWLRDYLYIPLGGNRCGALRTQANLMVTMLLGGLWHGASWMFVVWGGLHGTYLIGERFIKRSVVSQWAMWRSWPGKTVLTLVTFALVCFTWVFFRAGTLQSALGLSQSMLDVPNALLLARAAVIPGMSISVAEPLWLGLGKTIAVAAVVGPTLVMSGLLRDSSLEELVPKVHWFLHAVALASMVYLTLISMSGEDSAFIYFQF